MNSKKFKQLHPGILLVLVILILLVLVPLATAKDTSSRTSGFGGYSGEDYEIRYFINVKDKAKGLSGTAWIEATDFTASGTATCYRAVSPNESVIGFANDEWSGEADRGMYIRIRDEGDKDFIQPIFIDGTPGSGCLIIDFKLLEMNYGNFIVDNNEIKK